MKKMKISADERVQRLAGRWFPVKTREFVGFGWLVAYDNGVALLNLKEEADA